jgi:hypothetical protein
LKVAYAQFGIACLHWRQRRNPDFMKLSFILIPAAASLLLMGCNSLDNPITNLFHGTGRDERVYNTQTGQWEWPPDKRQKKAAATANTASPQAFNDTRYWDPQRNQWVQQDQPPTSAPSKTKPAAPSDAPAPATAQAAPPPPPPAPRSPQATGVYNSSTGKIEWQTSDAHVPRGATAPEPKKRWYWPF